MEPGRGTFDHDLDSQLRRPVPDSIEPIDEYQRLVANPFLTVLAWLVVLGLVRESVNRQNVAMFMTGIIIFFVAFFLLQYHCLDCGATGWLLRSWAHACPAVVDRRRSGLVRRFRGPGLRLQLAAWFIIMMAALVLGAVALGSRP